MKRTGLLNFIVFVIFTTHAVGQGKALTFQEAEKQGMPFQQLDSTYKSAVHADINLAVFKSPEEQAKLQQAYAQLLQDLGTFLRKNNFVWEKQTRGMNRIYLSPDGRINYFLYNFPAGQLRPEKEKEFSRLLNLFIQDYTFNLTANEKFAQCSPVKYSDS